MLNSTAGSWEIYVTLTQLHLQLGNLRAAAEMVN